MTCIPYSHGTYSVFNQVTIVRTDTYEHPLIEVARYQLKNIPCRRLKQFTADYAPCWILHRCPSQPKHRCVYFICMCGGYDWVASIIYYTTQKIAQPTSVQEYRSAVNTIQRASRSVSFAMHRGNADCLQFCPQTHVQLKDCKFNAWKLSFHRFTYGNLVTTSPSSKWQGSKNLMTQHMKCNSAGIRIICRAIQSVGATGGVYKGQGRNRSELIIRTY